MSLDIKPIPEAVGGTWNAIPTTCHMSTLYWLHAQELRELTTQDEYLNAFPNPTGTMTGMLMHGRAASKPMRGNLRLEPGSVIIFSKNNQALHSCVARDHNTIAGYNQTDWFSSAGRSHDHSTHTVADIKWTGALNKEVLGNSPRNSPCKLIIVQENAARAYVRECVQRVVGV